MFAATTTATLVRLVTPPRATSRPRASPASASRGHPENDAKANHPVSVPTRAFLAATLAATLVSAPVDPALAATVFTGKYIDPNHPHCPREIDASGVVSGIDPVPFEKGRGCRGYKKANEARAIEAGKITAWKIDAQIAKDDTSIFIDFDQKDGSGESFTGVWNGVGVAFPDGNVWSKINERGPPTTGAALSQK
jgi:F-box protein 18 (helicase)